jgi:Gpi18-like mannosyltransferase
MWGIWLITRFTAPQRHIRIILLSFINIAFWYNAIIFGQVDSIFSTLAFASVYMAIKGNIKNALMFMLLSLNFKLQAIIFVPIIVIFLIPYFFKSFDLKRIMVVLSSLIFLQLAIIFPFMMPEELGRIKNVVTGAVDFYPVVSMNAYNIWDLLLEGNLKSLEDNIVVNGLSYKNWGLLMFFTSSFIALTPLLIISFRKRKDEVISYLNNQNTLNIIFLSCGLIPLLFFFCNTQMHERYSHPALLFIFAFSYVNKNYIPLLLFSFAYFFNLDGVLREFDLGIIGNNLFRNRDFIAILYAILILYMFFYLYKISIIRERIFSKSSTNSRQEEGKYKSRVEAART